MKTSEFIERLDEHRDEILNVENIFSDDELYLTSIKTNQFNITFYHDKEPSGIIDIVAEYLNTPVKEREEEKKFYLRQKGIGSWNFLNFNINSQEHIVASNKYDYTYKTQFTQSEIDEMPECYTHPAVWEKVEAEEN